MSGNKVAYKHEMRVYYSIITHVKYNITDTGVEISLVSHHGIKKQYEFLSIKIQKPGCLHFPSIPLYNGNKFSGATNN